ncbi:MAG: hypothetical protein VX248_14820 [Pseudomonadota bacterium]|nr:hypothetical protein [Pseudomonadota bacterium]
MDQVIRVIALALLPSGLWAAGEDHATPYAGFQDRAIKSLSDDDIAELRRGGGWGLALPAELSGLPGPAHLLEMQDEIGLSEDQVARITVIYDGMKAEAIEAGEKFIAAEAALSEAFAAKDMDPDSLRALLAASAEARAALRFVHLSRHLMTPDVLSEDQIAAYQRLRGYADDPCQEIPEGHDPDMWRRHNGCE